MREFDKWFDTEYPVDHSDYFLSEQAWKAALEWALTNKKPIKYNAYKFDYIKTDAIEEELNAKT